MITNRNKIRVPFQYRHWITKEDRIAAFKEISKGYEKYGLKCIYAFLNTDPDFLMDYAIIYKGKNDDKTNDIILYDMVPINSDRCTPNYLYYKMIGKEKQFFQFGVEEMVVVSPNQFYGFLERRCLLNRDKKSKQFWKKLDNAKVLTDELLDASFPYRRPELRNEEMEEG